MIKAADVKDEAIKISTSGGTRRGKGVKVGNIVLVSGELTPGEK